MSRIYTKINLISYELNAFIMIAIVFFINKNQVFNRNCEKKLCNAKGAKNKLIMKSPWSYFLLNVPELSVYSNLHESIRVMENRREFARILWRVNASPTLCIPIYSNISELIELFVIYSKSSPIFTNYKKLSDIIRSNREWTAPRR